MSGVRYRADVKWQDEDDEEAEVPGQQGPQEDHPLLLSHVSIALQEVKCQEKHNNNHDSECSAAHSDRPTGRRQEVMVSEEDKRVIKNMVNNVI